jgi:hypothetical protein
MIMSNPYTVLLSLTWFDTLLCLDEKNTVHIEGATRMDPNRKHVFDLAKEIWIKEFHMSENYVYSVPLGQFTIVVVYSNDDMGISNPLSAARFAIYEDQDTSKKTVKIFSVASIPKEKRNMANCC